MLAVPPAFLDQLQLQAGAAVGIAIDQGKLMITPNPPPRYTLEELLAQCHALADIPQEDKGWLCSPPIGSELV